MTMFLLFNIQNFLYYNKCLVSTLCLQEITIIIRPFLHIIIIIIIMRKKRKKPFYNLAPLNTHTHTHQSIFFNPVKNIVGNFESRNMKESW